MLPNSQIIHLQKNTGESYHFEMIEVVSGTFRMGDDKSTGIFTNREKPEHEVHVPTFWLGKFPVVQSLYEFVMGENPSYFKGDNRPVESVSWEVCKTFIEKLNALSGKNFRLPSEAEWEYAARGGIHWKDNYEYSGGKELDKYGWYDENSHQETKPVGLKLPNQLGLYDMSGNVWEWCEDDWHDSYENAPDDGSPWINESKTTLEKEQDKDTSPKETIPKTIEKTEKLDLQENENGVEEDFDFDDLDLEDIDFDDLNFDEGSKLVRGGSWVDDTLGCRVAIRGNNGATDSLNSMGLRLALPQF